MEKLNDNLQVFLKRMSENNPELKEAINKIYNMSEEEKLEQKVKWFNETEGALDKEDGYHCDKCKNKGHVQYIKDGEVTTKYCECMKKRSLIRRAKNSGLGDYLNKRSKDYIVIKEWQKFNFNLMSEYCRLQPNIDYWFTLCGQSGSGKTLIGSIIANHLLFNLNKEVIYITWTDFISKLKRDMMDKETSNVSSYLEEIKNVEILFIDELLKKYNETDLKYIIEIINYRYTNNLKTIITTEKSIEELIMIDEATFGRVIEKSSNYIIEMEKDMAKNYRLKNMKNYMHYWND